MRPMIPRILVSVLGHLLLIFINSCYIRSGRDMGHSSPDNVSLNRMHTRKRKGLSYKIILINFIVQVSLSSILQMATQ